jgi:hypothetical protein
MSIFPARWRTARSASSVVTEGGVSDLSDMVMPRNLSHGSVTTKLPPNDLLPERIDLDQSDRSTAVLRRIASEGAKAPRTRDVR